MVTPSSQPTRNTKLTGAGGAPGVTRAVLCSLSEFTGLSSAIRIALSVEEVAHDVTEQLPWTVVPYSFYEVSVSPNGAWWLPAGPTWPPAPKSAAFWKNVSSSDLAATGDIPTLSIVRPTNLLWWVPRGGIEESLTPVYVTGQVKGSYPTQDPYQSFKGIGVPAG